MTHTKHSILMVLHKAKSLVDQHTWPHWARTTWVGILLGGGVLEVTSDIIHLVFSGAGPFLYALA